MGCGYRDYTVDEAPHVGRWLVGFGFTVPFSRDDGLIRVQQETFTLMSFSEPLLGLNVGVLWIIVSLLLLGVCALH